MENNQLDITAFDSCAESDVPIDVELKHGDGVTDTGIVLQVLGKHSDVVTRHANKVVNKMLMDNEIAKRKGEEPKARTIEDIRASNIDGAAVRVVGWKNVKQEFSRDVLKAALKRNPHWIDQIVKESDDLGNYSRAQPTSSSATPDTN